MTIQCSGDNIFNEKFGCIQNGQQPRKNTKNGQAIPATSVHFNYDKPANVESNSKDWNIKQKIIVEASSENTYFMTIGFSPGGYSGIQQRPNDKIAIFSLWNDRTNDAELVETGKKATTQEFGGEGTGLKTTMPFNWKIGNPVEFWMRGWLEEGTKNTWHVACWVRQQKKNGKNGKWLFIAEYKRTGKQILNDWGYYSFVEDWDRSWNAKGHKKQRKAAYGQATWNDEKVTGYRFNKVDNPNTLDYAAHWKTWAEESSGEDEMAKLSTGGNFLMDGPIVQGKNQYVEL